MVIWDKIIRRGDSAVLDLKDMKAKYYFFDDGHGLRFVCQLFCKEMQNLFRGLSCCYDIR